MNKIILLLGFLIFSQNNCNQNQIKFFGGADIELRDSLKNDSEFVEISCGEKADEIIDKESKIKLKSYQDFTNENGLSKLKMVCKTIEGDPIYSYLRVQNGEASILIDISEDKNGSKEITLYKCRDLEIGKFYLDEKIQEPIFQKLKSSDLEREKELTMRCLSEKEKILF